MYPLNTFLAVHVWFKAQRSHAVVIYVIWNQ